MAERKFYDKFVEKKSSSKKNRKNKEDSRGKGENDISKKDFRGKQNAHNNEESSIKNTRHNERRSDVAINKNTAEKLSSRSPRGNTQKTTSRTERHINPDAQIISCTSSFSTKPIPKDSLAILNDFDKIIQENRPLNSKQIQQLPDNIRELSHQLTDQRADRRLGYMNENTKLSAYVRYFTWWNLVRLTRLFANLPANAFPQNDGICLDLGSGPLTVVTALWLARPELRSKKLTWYCLDISQNSMTLGEDVYYSVAARTIAKSMAYEKSETDSNATQNSLAPEACWKIIRVKGSFGTQIKEKADFITCANMFNELDQAGDMPPEFQTKKYFDQLNVYSTKDARFILIEPGVPKAARTISLLRDRFIRTGKKILAPCPHATECPMNGFKAYTGSSHKWCNFAFSTEDAPVRLQKLSDSAKLPKERATLSYVCAVPEDDTSNTDTQDTLKIRVVSDSFRLPGNITGVYACTKFGLTLIAQQNVGENKSALSSGDLLEIKLKTPVDSLRTDEKTGAKVIAI
ncbi:MAG: small ribosomal subunit Rsm22 family protein [Treponema sp.]|nr:small ribosomal subunit Rsm22 family protein [Treponema sp.]